MAGSRAGRRSRPRASKRLAFQEAAGLHLCQEFIGYNPARLPTPAEWVTVRRIRVKDAYTRLWWLSPTPHPKADNRRVLTAYSDSMKKLLQKGTYNGGARPSGHHVGHRSFLKQNGGAIPPNVLVPPADDPPATVIPISNTGSRSRYLDACRAMNVTGHPARMPELLRRFLRAVPDRPGRSRARSVCGQQYHRGRGRELEPPLGRNRARSGDTRGHLKPACAGRVMQTHLPGFESDSFQSNPSSGAGVPNSRDAEIQ